jgi:hypothetical protein
MSDTMIKRQPGRPCASSFQGSMPDNRRGRKANMEQGVGWSRSTCAGG